MLQKSPPIKFSHVNSFLKHSVKPQPSFSMLHELKTLTNTIVHKRQALAEFSKEKQVIQGQLSSAQFEQLSQLRKQKVINQQITKLLRVQQKLNKLILKWSVEEDQNQTLKAPLLQRRARSYGEICETLFEFENSINYFLEKTGEINKTHEDNQARISKLKGTLYEKIREKLISIDKKFSDNRQALDAMFKKLGLPLRRNKGQSFIIPSDEQANFLMSFLHYEACSSSLHRIIDRLVDNQSQQGINSDSNKQKIVAKKPYFFEPLFFRTYWPKIFKSVNYIFLMEGECHNIEEPVWFFQHLQETFNLNFRCFAEHILNRDYPEVVSNQVRNYIISSNFDYFFLQLVIQRLQVDLPLMQDPFLIFNFLDQLYQFQEKLGITFNSPNLDFVTRILVQFRDQKILERNFIHEHQWIETKIFSDFYNMDYSTINPKNIEAYNIVQNYITLFEKLYSKFRKVSDPLLIQQIQKFYQNSILQLIAHIKTSFDRIYNYSGLSKFDIICAYKRVQNQFRGYFSSLLNQTPIFQSKVQQQLYGYLTQFFIQYALEELSPIHKKVIKRLTEYNDDLTRSSNKKSKEEQQKERKRKISVFRDIYKEWQTKVQSLTQIQPYVDQKLKNIFFVYLETTQFSIEGFKLFREIFEPFLGDVFSAQGLRTINQLLDMGTVELVQYIDNPPAPINFLTAKQLQSLQRKQIK